MGQELDANYYVSQMANWLAEFDADAKHLRPLLARAHGQDLADSMLSQARQRFVALLPQLPYIGDDNALTGELVNAARCLALYQAMQAHGKTAAEAGKALYDSVAARVMSLSQAAPQRNVEELMRHRQERAARSQRRQYAADWVYTFVAGDGEAFDYGYDFAECAAQKLYHAHGADEFLPYYCFLDFAVSKAAGLGLQRTMTLAEGHAKCDHRFKRGGPTGQDWPPPWLREPQTDQRRLYGDEMKKLALVLLPDEFAVCRLAPDEAIPPWPSSCSFWSITRTAEELSMVAPEGAVPDTWQAERGWRCLKVQGPLDFGLTGILSALSAPLAEAGISIFALSTYDTDYLLVRAVDLDKARSVLTAQGHVFVQ